LVIWRAVIESESFHFWFDIVSLVFAILIPNDSIDIFPFIALLEFSLY
jgi:hypothetical protein